MDEQRFDAALRALHTATTRRTGLAGMLGVLLGGAGRDAAAGGGPEPEGPCGKGNKNRCKKNAGCCTKYCVKGRCRTKPNYMPCEQASECSINRCVKGRCDGGANPAGADCEEDFNCDDGLACVKGVCKASTSAKCTKRNCPGCCQGTVCRVGSSNAACGANGGTCIRCLSSACQNGTCSGGGACSPATCPSGCCKNGACKPGTVNSACGTGGGACASCTGGKTCQAGRCKGGGGSCSAATCPNGCCDGATCKSGSSDNACGSGGGSCAACTGGQTCQNGTCVTPCSSSSCANGCCDGDTCVTATSSAQCGTGGAACVACSGNTSSCRDGACAAPEWSYLAGFGAYGTNSGDLNGPRGVHLSPDQLTLWIADMDNNGVKEWTRPDAASTVWNYSTEITGLNKPADVFVSASGLTAWVANTLGNSVMVYTRVDTSQAWTLETSFGSAANLTQPYGLAVSADELTVWVSSRENGNATVQVWTRLDTTTNATNWTSGGSQGTFQIPNGVAISGDQLTLMVTDQGFNAVFWFTRPDAASTAWAYKGFFGTQGSGASNFDTPNYLEVSSDGLTAWITDGGNSRVSIWSRPDAASTTWTNQTTFGTFGQADDQFYAPNGIAVSPDGLTVWVANAYTSRVAIWSYS